MALLDLFKKKPEPPKKFVLVDEGKVVREDNPLPGLLPGLYESEPDDGFARRDEILEDADTLTRDLFYACRLPLETLPKLTKVNLERLLEIPCVYELLVTLKRQKMTQFYENTLALLSITQACAFYTQTEVGLKLRANLMPTLLGISLRYLGMMFIKREERDVLKLNRQFDVSDARQKDLRDQHLKRYRQVADTIATTSTDRLHELTGKTHTMSKDRYKELLQIVRYSTRLMGRAAASLTPKEKESVYSVPKYIAMLYNFTSAWVSKRKRAPLVLAEEWGRCRNSFTKKDFEGRTGNSLQALSDLFHICRCQVLQNFQESGRDAIYCTPERIVVKEVKMVAELKDNSDSVRRFITPESKLPGEAESTPANERRRTASDMRSRLQGATEKAVEVRKARIQYRWQCYKSRVPIQHQGRSLMEALEVSSRQSKDPSDDQLDPVD